MTVSMWPTQLTNSWWWAPRFTSIRQSLFTLFLTNRTFSMRSKISLQELFKLLEKALAAFCLDTLVAMSVATGPQRIALSMELDAPKLLRPCWDRQQECAWLVPWLDPLTSRAPKSFQTWLERTCAESLTLRRESMCKDSGLPRLTLQLTLWTRVRTESVRSRILTTRPRCLSEQAFKTISCSPTPSVCTCQDVAKMWPRSPTRPSLGSEQNYKFLWIFLNLR